MNSSVFLYIFCFFHINSSAWPVLMKVRLLSIKALTYSKSPSAAFITTAPTAVIVLQAEEDHHWKNHLIMQRDTQETVNENFGPRCFQEQIREHP